VSVSSGVSVNTTQAAYRDRRIPYYVVSGCDYMLSAEEQCDASKYPPAVACCPLGYECLLDAAQNVSGAFRTMTTWLITEQPYAMSLSPPPPSGLTINILGKQQA